MSGVVDDRDEREQCTVDTETAAVALGRSPRTVRRMVAAGRLSNAGTARAIRVRLSDLLNGLNVR